MTRTEAVPYGRRQMMARDFGSKPNVEEAQKRENIGLIGKSLMRFLGMVVNGVLKRIRPKSSPDKKSPVQ